MSTDPALKTFTLEGTDRMGRRVGAHSFSCYPVMQGEILAQAIAKVSSDEAQSLTEISAFIRESLIDEDVERFNALITGKDFIVELKALGEVMSRLVEEYGDRPTAASSSLPGGPVQMPPTSMGAGISTASPIRSIYPPTDGSTPSTQPLSTTQVP